VIWASIEPIWQDVLAEAWAAYAAGSHPIGALFTTPDGEIVARGRNRTRDDLAAGYLHGSRLAHAEMNAILALPSGLDRTTVTLWATTEPCPMCIGAIAIAKIRRVRFACRDPYAGSADLAAANWFMRSRGVEVRGPERHDVEAVLTVMEVEFALRAGWAHDLYLKTMRTVLPEPVDAAVGAHATGWLWRLATSGASVGEAVDAIASDRLLVQGV
jgi:tRNA(adenine34) deaminase